MVEAKMGGPLAGKRGPRLFSLERDAGSEEAKSLARAAVVAAAGWAEATAVEKEESAVSRLGTRATGELPCFCHYGCRARGIRGWEACGGRRTVAGSGGSSAIKEMQRWLRLLLLLPSFFFCPKTNSKGAAAVVAAAGWAVATTVERGNSGR
ncbi:hypothetical protein C4D60_Mb09t07110 [Musa balbisiana]|uniref:Uncharacterized protein n=1 Tax=Musa balbisiana TaxID=52838 RepID=A0A4V4H332_MUSBA|nr:hypothetical protein C4D60_Mb09t07110 [Musa balbisiana]